MSNDEVPSLIRTKESYELNKNNKINSLGIKEDCVFNLVYKFHITNNKSVDIMHDIFEGIAHYTLSKVLTHLLFVKHICSLDFLYNCIARFDYGNFETSKPQPLIQEYSKNKNNKKLMTNKKIKFKQSASETLCLIRYLGIMIGYLITDGNEHWKFFFTLIYPMALLPVFLTNNIASMRCIYVVLLMAGYWVFEALPLAVTALIPMVLFPLMGILDSDKTSLCYLKETNMMFVGGLIIAIAVEHCNLHTRVALYVIKWVGCSPRRLNLGLITVTMLVSMWISNTAATAMMIPIIEATLKELEDQGIGSMYEPESLPDPDAPPVAEAKPQEPSERRPTKTTMCYFISTAYAASIGGCGSIVGSGTNLTFKGIYEARFPDSPGVEFVKWMMLNVPMMLVRMYVSWVWMQFWFMGLFRPNSEDAKRIRVGQEGEEVALQLIKQRIEVLGPMSFHEAAVGVMFLLSVLLWFFRKPQFIPGWAEMITDFKVKDATAAMIVVMLLFLIPAQPAFIHMCSRDPEKRPMIASQALITWKVVQQKMPWGLMSLKIAENLKTLTDLPPFAMLTVACCVATFLTQFISSNVACANILLPVLAEMAVVAKIHPMYLTLSTALCCSHAYCLPVSTPPNAIAAAPCNMPSSEMMKVGVGVALISLGTLGAIFPFLAGAIWDFDKFPDWAV